MTPYPFHAHPVVTDLTVCFSCPSGAPSTCALDARTWHCIGRELYLGQSHRTAWLYVAFANEEDLGPEDVMVMDIKVGKQPPSASSGEAWEHRRGGIWLLRRRVSGHSDRAATAIDILFGPDAVEPRPQWTLSESALELNGHPEIPAARLSVLYGKASPISDVRRTLSFGKDGIFSLLQLADLHMVTGVGSCKDAIDAAGENLPESEADPLTVKFVGEILDAERPDLVILTGDQVHHDTLDSQTALFKAVAPFIDREIPYAVCFGNHDSEGTHALSRTEQMSILRKLPFSLCDFGPEHVDGVGNFCLDVLDPAPSNLLRSTIYCLDSHGQKPSRIHNPDYDPIKQSQIDWFTGSCQARRNARKKGEAGSDFYQSLVFQHIPLPEFGDRRLSIRSGHRREPTEGPRINSHFYDALVTEGVSAFACGHDHVNDFCALLPQRTPRSGEPATQRGPWLCYAGGAGFGGYGSRGKRRFHRRARVWQLDMNTRSLKTWKRVEYGTARVDELTLVEDGIVVDEHGEQHGEWNCVLS